MWYMCRTRHMLHDAPSTHNHTNLDARARRLTRSEIRRERATGAWGGGFDRSPRGPSRGTSAAGPKRARRRRRAGFLSAASRRGFRGWAKPSPRIEGMRHGLSATIVLHGGASRTEATEASPRIPGRRGGPRRPQGLPPSDGPVESTAPDSIRSFSPVFGTISWRGGFLARGYKANLAMGCSLALPGAALPSSARPGAACTLWCASRRHSDRRKTNPPKRTCLCKPSFGQT